MYQLTDVIDTATMETKKEAWNLIGKDFELQDAEVGKQARLNNISDAHMFQRTTKTSIIDSVRESFREISLIAKDTMYILKKY